jgi:hypothetical protein
MDVLADAIIDEITQHDPGGDENLEETGDSPSDFLGTAFGDIGRRNCRDSTNANTGDNPPSIDHVKAGFTGVSGCLEDGTDDEDEAEEEKSVSTTDLGREV